MSVLPCFLCDSISFWLQGPWKSVFQTSENISAFKRFSLPAGCLCLADSSGCLVLFGFLNRLSDSRILFSLINDNRLQINAHHLSDLENLTAPKTVSSARTTLTIGPAVGLGICFFIQRIRVLCSCHVCTNAAILLFLTLGILMFLPYDLVDLYFVLFQLLK